MIMREEIKSPASQPMLSPETLQDGPWFESVRKAYGVRTKPSHPPKWLVPVIGFGIAGILWLLGYHKTAIIGGSIVAVMTLLEFVHPATARKVQKGLAVFGAWAGQAIGWLLLAPLFLIVGPISRVFARVMGADPLGLRAAGAPSYWHFGADESTRTKMTGSMFCVERRTAGGRNWLGALALLGGIGLIAGELILRFWFGFHNPLLYMQDSQCGYRLRPEQDIRTGRGAVQVNNLSMRYARDISAEKPAGVFRILILSDSTGFGGEYHTNEQTYSGLMESRLNARDAGGSRRYEVLPVCVNGWGPLHALGYVNKYGIFAADLVLVTMSAGNIDRPLTQMAGTRYLASKPRFAWETVMVMAGDAVKRRIATGGRDYLHDDAEAYRQHEEGAKAFLNLGLAVREKGCPDVYFEAPPQLCYDQDAFAATVAKDGRFNTYYQRTQAKLEPAGFVMEYPQTLLKGLGTRAKNDIFADGGKDEGHYSARGHSIYADYLIGQLAARSAAYRKHARLPEPAVPHQPNLPQPTP